MQLHKLLTIALGFRFGRLVAAVPSTFWVQADCFTPMGQQPGTSFTTALNEARRFAQRAGQRLAATNDQGAQNLWNLIFGTTNNQAKSAAITMYNTIANLRQITNQQTADIRIYCDDDHRWEDNTIIQRWIDSVNWMSLNAITEQPACADNDQNDPSRSTLGGTYTIADPHPPLPDDRSVITICDRAFFDPKGNNRYLVIPANLASTPGALHNFNIKNLNFLSATILHEFTHATPFNTDDVNGRNGYGWDNIRGFATSNPAQAIQNADSYAFFGLGASLTGYTIAADGTIN